MLLTLKLLIIKLLIIINTNNYLCYKIALLDPRTALQTSNNIQGIIKWNKK